MWRLTPVVVVALWASALMVARQPVFEVAAVKMNASGPGPSFGLMVLPGGRVFAQNVPLRELVRAAYGLEDSQLEGGPPWIRSTRYDVEGRAGSEVTIETARAMVRTLLAQRFRLAAHTEVRQLPIYELVMARGDRALGKALRTSGPDCAPVTLPAGLPPAPPPPAGAGLPVAPGGVQCPSGFLPGHLSIRKIDMPAFASVLWRRIGQRPIVDRTGRSGYFDIDLTYLPELESVNGRPASENPSLPAAIAAAPSIFTAVQEQLGLKLESTRGPVDVLVIDRVEALIEN
jgi:uncharacterized protein (TIGR03435 family)